MHTYLTSRNRTSRHVPCCSFRFVMTGYSIALSILVKCITMLYNVTHIISKSIVLVLYNFKTNNYTMTLYTKAEFVELALQKNVEGAYIHPEYRRFYIKNLNSLTADNNSGKPLKGFITICETCNGIFLGHRTDGTMCDNCAESRLKPSQQLNESYIEDTHTDQEITKTLRSSKLTNYTAEDIKHIKELKKQEKLSSASTRHCAYCDTTISSYENTTPLGRLYCGPIHRRLADKGYQPVTFICHHCNKHFKAVHYQYALFCCDECHNAYKTIHPSLYKTLMRNKPYKYLSNETYDTDQYILDLINMEINKEISRYLEANTPKNTEPTTPLTYKVRTYFRNIVNNRAETLNIYDDSTINRNAPEKITTRKKVLGLTNLKKCFVQASDQQDSTK